MLRRILIGLCLAITVIAAGLYGRHLWLTRHVVYVGVPTSINQYDDDQPVEATLHEYDRTSPVSSYQTTGRSISFSFARRLYTFRGNARGGPQRHIWISVDRMSLDGVDTEKEWPKLGHPYIPKSNAYVLLSMSSHLQIKVFSNQSDSGEDFAIKSALEEGQINPFARFCGVTWYLRREISPWMTEPSALVPSNAPGPNFGVGATVIGIVDEAETNGRSGSVSCNAGGGDCDIYGTFEDWQMSFSIERPKLCEWPSEQERIRAFLAGHVVKRTERRDP